MKSEFCVFFPFYHSRLFTMIFNESSLWSNFNNKYFLFYFPLRFKCIVSYPKSSDFELELSVGDIIYVHKKRDNGWYKGTHAQTGKVGLFPSSFVEPII